jgi:hypothetical protein
MPYVAVFLAVVIAVARPFVPRRPVSPAGSYQALAHILVGTLIGLGIATMLPVYWVTLIALSAVEVACFLLLR